MDLWSNEGLDKPSQKRGQIILAWNTTFRFGGGHPTHAHDKCCVTFICHVYQISRSYLYYRPLYTTSTQRDESKTFGVMAWFNGFKHVCDPMPDQNAVLPGVSTHVTVYQVFFPNRKTVYQQYCSDAKAHSTSFPAMSRTHFLAVWRKFVPNFRLRKYLRFSRCPRCIELRAIRHGARTSPEDRKRADKALDVHYQMVKRERGAALGKHSSQFIN